jgi:hypothetical protein
MMDAPVRLFLPAWSSARNLTMSSPVSGNKGSDGRTDGEYAAAFVTIFVGACWAGPWAGAAELYHYDSAVEAPDCVEDVPSAFFSQNDQQLELIHLVLTASSFYLLVRFAGTAIAAPSFAFS